ncbi:ERI1 exoribonuclease 3 isoform X3 [Podarcis muralis]
MGKEVPDAARCSMVALVRTTAARLHLKLLPRARNTLRSLLRFFPQRYGSTTTGKLASHGFASMAAMSSFPPQRYHYFLVLDFEATCDKPQIHPQLTGIIQAMVDGQPSLQQVLERVDEWMAKEGLLDPSVKSIFVTCGDWDLKVMLPGQCQYLGLPVADYFKQWINLKKAYSFAMGSWPKNGLLDMNKGLNLQHIGRPHSGIDDCKNIANIMKTLAHRGFIFKQTSKPF